MKKLASLLTLFSLGLFAVGCTNQDGTAPSPDAAPATEGSSVGPAGDMADDTAGEGATEDDAPPATDEAPPAAEEPAPAGDAAAPTTEEAAANESATEAAAGEDAAEPAPAEGETAPQ